MKQFVAFLGVLLFLGCQDVKMPNRPENLISEDMMADILADAYIGNAARSTNNRILKSKGVLLDSILYKKYAVDSLQFAASNAFYTSNLNGYAAILKKVEERLLIKKVIVDTLYKQEVAEALRIKDSIRKNDSIQNIDSPKQKPIAIMPQGQLVDPVLDEDDE